MACPNCGSIKLENGKCVLCGYEITESKSNYIQYPKREFVEIHSEMKKLDTYNLPKSQLMQTKYNYHSDYSFYSPPKSGKANASLICGILAILFGCWPIVGFTLAIIAFVLSISARRNGPISNSGKAIAGMVLSIIAFVEVGIRFIIILNLYSS